MQRLTTSSFNLKGFIFQYKWQLCLDDKRHSSEIPLFNYLVAVLGLPLKKIVLQANKILKSEALPGNLLLAEFKLH